MLLSSWRHGRASSDDKENRALGTGNEALEKFDEDGSIDAAVLLDHEPHPASREGRPDQAHATACGAIDARLVKHAGANRRAQGRVPFSRRYIGRHNQLARTAYAHWAGRTCQVRARLDLRAHRRGAAPAPG